MSDPQHPAAPVKGLGTIASSAVILLVFVVIVSGLLAFGIRGTAVSAESMGPTAAPRTARPVAAVEATPAPSDAPGTHTVRTGETLHGIAVSLGTSDAQLRHWNYDQYPSLRSSPQGIAVGWVLTTVGPPMPTAPVAVEPPAGEPPGAAPAPTTAPPHDVGAPSSAGLVALPLLTVDVWNAAEVYHSITGRNPNDLTSAAGLNAPPNCDGHAACAGPATFDVIPEYIADPATGTCTLLGAVARVSYAAYIPQWTSPDYVPPELLTWWSQVLEHIRWHEEQHIRIYADNVSRLDALYAGQPCAAAEAIQATWLADVQAAQDAFHVQDAGWQLPQYSGPWDF